jgi:phenylpropionate dioxygenase-like ring-hydroxylating dioxygenase large terminal subunit
MLSKQENELLSRVGPGTPMGTLMRRFWLPALLSDELPATDGPPVRLRLLGEDLVAFRDTEGRVGVLEEGCPHRLASLWLGRNEESGLRCVYHGWKFDVTGRCVDQLNEPEPFTDKIRAVVYAVTERGGVIWTYMGPPEQTPPLPDFEYTRVAADKRAVTKVWEECGWLQALEGGIDSSHAPILHRNFVTAANDDGRAGGAMWRTGPPVLDLDETDYGYRYAGVRPLGADSQYVRGYHFVMPFTQLRPGSAGIERIPTYVSGHHWVPIDDYNCMVWNWHYSYGEDELTEQYRTMERDGDSDRYVNRANEFRAYGNRGNGWLIDREAQKKVSFTGIDGIHAQDRAVQESMGPLVHREREHLGPADRAIIVARRLLLDEVRAVAEGRTPRGVSESYYNLRAIERIFEKETPWREELLPLMYPTPKDAVEATAG